MNSSFIILGPRRAWVLAGALVAIIAGCTQQATTRDGTVQGAVHGSVQTELPEGIRLIDKVVAESGKTVIPFEKYVLDNGLTVILHEDHSDPLVHVDVTYHVGSGREEPGKSGFAHFFEHMMFQGSENVADEEHFKLVTEAGGTMNGSTSTDRTNYYQTVPSNQLDTVLWLESDRMGFLLNAVTQEKFENQRETVKNERGQNVDNRPYGRLRERVGEALYPEGHPYSWPTIGYIEDLNRVNVNDLKKFFLRWYGPNNATLTIGGDIDKVETLLSVQKYFAAIHRGPEVKMPQKPALSLDADRYISMEDNVHLPLIYMSIPTVYGRHKDEAPLDLLSEIMGGGKTSILYKNLVKNQFAVQASTSHGCTELACSFALLALPHPASGKTLAELETIFRDSIKEFESRGVEEDDLIKAKAKMEASFIFGLQSVSGKVSQLASYETYTHNPNWIEEDIKRYNAVTREEVMRVYEKYVKNNHAVIMRIVPNGAGDSVSPQDNFERPKRELDAISKTTNEELKFRVVTDDLDRSQRPSVGASPSVPVPDFWRKTLDEQIQVLGAKSIETPTTSLLIKVPGGHYYERAERSGLAKLTAELMGESTQLRSTEDMSRALQKLGSSISISSGDQYTSIFVNSLSKNLKPTLALLKEKIFSPAFNEADFNRVKQRSIQTVMQNKKDPSYLGRAAYSQLLYGDSIAGRPGGGTEETLTAITLEEVKNYYQSHFKPYKAKIIVVSDLSQQALLKSIEPVLAHWKGRAPELSVDFPIPSIDKTKIYLVNKDEAAQSSIRIGKRSITRDFTGEFYRLGLMNYALGGAFNSRINLNLREDKGYTYGAWSGFSGNKLSGTFTASASVRANATAASIKEFVTELSTYRESGVSDDELAFTRSAINQKDALKYETPMAKLGFLSKILEYDLPRDFVKQQAKIVDTVSQGELNELAKRYLDLDEMIMVVVGDGKTLRPELEALGYPVVDLEI